MSESDPQIIKDPESFEVIKVNANANVTDSEEKQKVEPHEKNKLIYEQKYVFPLLAADFKKAKRKYEDEPLEKSFSRFKSMSDPTIPYKRVVTTICRIRTLSNPDQALGEYILYLVNFHGFQKHFDPKTSELSYYEPEQAHALNVPIGMDKRLNLKPKWVNGDFKGYEGTTVYNYFTEKFRPELVDEIVANSDIQEGTILRYKVIDMGKEYGGYTKDELKYLRMDKLISRNLKKEMGTDIREEDKDNPEMDTITKKGKK